MNCNNCNEAADAETNCNVSLQTAAMRSNSCNEAAVAETNCNGCIATVAMTATITMKLQLQKLTATVALQMQQ